MHTQSKSPSGRHLRTWSCEAPRAAVVISHGLGEHSGRYDELARHLAGKGYMVRALDHLGHGQSPGQRGHVGRFVELTDGVSEVVDQIADEHPSLPCVLIGHSLGGLVVARYLLDQQEEIAAAILSGALFQVAVSVPWWKETAGKMLSDVWPRLSMANEIDTSLLSHDAAIVRAYDDDPLVHDKISARLYTEFTRTMDEVLSGAEEILVPLLVLAGAADRVVAPEGSMLFHRDAAAPTKELHVFDGMYHEIFNEIGRGTVHQTVTDWLDRVLL